MQKIIIFPAGSENLINEIYCLPTIMERGGGRIAAVKLGIPGGSTDGRISYGYDFHSLHIEWLQRYAPTVSVVDNLPRNWVPLPEDAPTPTLDLELTSRPTNPGPIDEPDDKSEWERKTDPVERDFERELRKRQWQSTLPPGEFNQLLRPDRGRPTGIVNKSMETIKGFYNRIKEFVSG